MRKIKFFKKIKKISKYKEIAGQARNDAVTTFPGLSGMQCLS